MRSVIPRTMLGARVDIGRCEMDIDEPLVDHAGPLGGVVRADRRRALVAVPDVARFAIEDGRRITIDPAPDAHPHDVEAWMHATVTALLLAQQDRFALHATLVEIDGVAVAIAGRVGAGKSTTALRLGQRGHTLLCDDVVPLAPGPDATRYLPTTRPARVLPETAARLGLDLNAAKDAGSRAGKLLIRHATPPAGDLGAVVVLQAAGVEPASSAALAPHASVPVLHRNAYRSQLLAPWTAELFAWAAAVAGTTPVHALRRPADRWTVDEVAAEIERIASRCRDALAA